MCIELEKEYARGALGRFHRPVREVQTPLPIETGDSSAYYRVARPVLLWNGAEEEPLPGDGGSEKPK